MAETFAAFIRAEYDPSSNGFAAFKQAASSAGAEASEEVSRHFRGSAEAIERVLSSALTRPLTKGGALDLGVGDMRQAVAAAEAKAAAYRTAAVAAEALAAKEISLSGAQQVIIARAREAADATAVEATRMREQLVTFEQLQTELNAVARVAGMAGAANLDLARTHAVSGMAANNARIAQLELGHVIRGSLDQYAAGAPASQIFAMHIGMVTEAASLGGKSFGRFGEIMAGPWGLAISLGIGLLSQMVPKLFDANNEVEEGVKGLRDQAHQSVVAAAAQRAYGATVEGVTASIRDQNKELEKHIRTLEDDIRLQKGKAQGDLETARKNLTDTNREIIEAYRELQGAKQNRDVVVGGGDTGATDVTANSERIAAAEKRYREAVARKADLERTIATGERNLRMLDFPLVERAAKEAVDPLAAINRRYDDMVTHAEAAAAGNRDLAASLDATLIRIERNRKAAVEAEEERQRLASRTPKPADADLTRFGWPVEGRRTGIFGDQRPGHRHAGIDIAVPVGTDVSAAAGGTVIEAGTLPGYGNVIIIDHGRGTTTRYAHLSKLMAQKGQTVGAGDVIALSGGAKGAAGSGNSEGPHLHYEVRVHGRAVDPRKGSFPTDELAAGEKAARSAAQAIAELDSALDATTRRFDPAAAAATDYANALAQIDRLVRAGRLSPETADDYRIAAAKARAAALIAASDAARRPFEAEFSDGLKNAVLEIRGTVEDVLGDGGAAAAKRFREETIEAADLIGQVLGGRLAGALNIAEGLLGGGSGSLGRIVMATTTPKRQPGDIFEPESKLAHEVHAFVEHLAAGLKIDPQSADRIGHVVGALAAQALQGAAIGDAVAGFVFKGKKGAKAGAEIGGAIGSMAGAASGIPGGQQIGGLIGSLEGGLIGSLFDHAKQAGSKFAVDSFGNISVAAGSGDKASGQAAVVEAKNVASSIQQIAKQLGGSVVGSALTGVTLGYRASDKKQPFRVDTTGAGRATGNGVLAFATQEEATAKAIQLMIERGVIGGISAASQKILKSGQDLQTAIEKAAAIESIPKRLKALKDPVGAALDDLNAQFETLVSALREGGASAAQMADAEQLYSLERKKAVDEAGKQMTSAFQGLLDSLTTNNDALSLRDRLAAAHSKFDPLEAEIRSGDYSHASEFAEAGKAVEAIMRQLNGSQDSYFSFLAALTDETKTALAAQQAKVDAAAAAANPFAGGAPVDTTPAIDRLSDRVGGILEGRISGTLDAINDNLGTLVVQGVGGGGGGFGGPLAKSANF